MQKNLSKQPFHIFIFCILPLSILVSSNISEINLASTTRAFLVVLFLGIVLLSALALWPKQKNRIAICVSLGLITFFSYGHLYDFLRNLSPDLINFIRHRFLMPFTTILLGGAIFWIVKKLSDDAILSMTSATNWIALILVCYNMVTILIYQYQENSLVSPFRKTGIQERSDTTRRPDVYFIILDSYTRDDVFKSFFDFDNSPFTNQLRDLGFYIPACSQSNYSYTISSVSSTLNMDYLDQFNIKAPSNPKSILPYQKLFQNSIVKRDFQQAGYKIVTSDSEFPWLVWQDADVIFKMPSQNGITNKFQPFELMFLKTTALRYMTDQNPDAKLVSYKVTKYQLASYQISRLKTLAEDVSSPKFLFINLEVTHPPFVFNPDGSINDETGFSEDLKFTDYPQFKADYVKAVQYINGQIIDIVHNILDNSEIPPIIIIQGDHGFRDKDYTNMNLEAFLIPGGESYYYPSLSPVNTFRIIENTLFDRDFQLLPDLHFHRVGKGYYEFEQVFETMPGCAR